MVHLPPLALPLATPLLMAEVVQFKSRNLADHEMKGEQNSALDVVPAIPASCLHSPQGRHRAVDSKHIPDPRTNSTACNTWLNSTLCDPDHILTDHWRGEINQNIHRQTERLKEANIQYTDKAPAACSDNSTTEGVQIFVILAKRIQTANNQTITEQDLTNFGNELARKYGLDQEPCKNFLLLIGIEAAKLAYVRTGKDLRLPTDLMQRVFHKYSLFKVQNYMEGLNKIVDEIGEQMLDPFKVKIPKL
uniref:Uncharacterized protein n=1 Tax=Ditylenchus dipsaci TaxID=166011 RepID=A0A915EPM8_9BILA